MSQYHQQPLKSLRRLVPGKHSEKGKSDADKYDVSGLLVMSCKILGPCCQTSQMSWMQCLTWREIVIDHSDVDEDDDCCDAIFDSDRTGKIILNLLQNKSLTR